MDGDRIPTSSYEYIGDLRVSGRYLENQRKRREEHGLEEEEIHKQIIESIERIVGPLLDWQIMWAIAAISGRGVEWTQTRKGSHFHIMDLPCPVCGGGGSVGMY